MPGRVDSESRQETERQRNGQLRQEGADEEGRQRKDYDNYTKIDWMLGLCNAPWWWWSVDKGYILQPSGLMDSGLRADRQATPIHTHLDRNKEENTEAQRIKADVNKKYCHHSVAKYFKRRNVSH